MLSVPNKDGQNLSVFPRELAHVDWTFMNSDTSVASRKRGCFVAEGGVGGSFILEVTEEFTLEISQKILLQTLQRCNSSSKFEITI